MPGYELMQGPAPWTHTCALQAFSPLLPRARLGKGEVGAESPSVPGALPWPSLRMVIQDCPPEDCLRGSSTVLGMGSLPTAALLEDGVWNGPGVAASPRTSFS